MFVREPFIIGLCNGKCQWRDCRLTVSTDIFFLIEECLLRNNLSHLDCRPLHDSLHWNCYGVATISRLLQIISLFCRILSLLQGSFAKETYDLKEPTHRSHPMHCRIHRVEILRFLGISRYKFKLKTWSTIWICTQESEFGDLVDFGGAVFSVGSVI